MVSHAMYVRCISYLRHANYRTPHEHVPGMSFATEEKGVTTLSLTSLKDRDACAGGGHGKEGGRG